VKLKCNAAFLGGQPRFIETGFEQR
jgi:hypothetical protein